MSRFCKFDDVSLLRIYITQPVDFSFGRRPANSFTLRADYVMADRPFSISERRTRSWRATRAGATAFRGGARRVTRQVVTSRQRVRRIIFTTIQKCSLENEESDHPVLRARANVVVITDEAHRSKYGTNAKRVDVKDRPTKEPGNLTPSSAG